MDIGQKEGKEKLFDQVDALLVSYEFIICSPFLVKFLVT